MHDSDRLRAAKQGLYQAEVGTQKGSQTRQRYPRREAKRQGQNKQDSNTTTLGNDYERVLVRELENINELATRQDTKGEYMQG